ncbi:NCS2 family permease [Parasutterella muris]|uniref:NCS2 family permease n=2 Tax=Parasutterella TaxID=577310 RepID=A0A6L6YJT7_9BURK|nr:NCS2 family permease [Parasutterella muris]MVX57927.1 NCS2 family permease [Parasutterella muris]
MNSLLQRYFGFNPAETTIRTEIIAGVSTFLTMAYILAVNPTILGVTGMDKGALFATTAITSGIATLIMALHAKMPFGLAPGMGINAFFAYTVCLSMGHTWQFALTAVLLEGLIFIFLTVTNIREKIVYSLPPSIQKAIGVGIGLFIAFIGLQNAGISVKNDATLVALGQIFQPGVLLVIIGLISTSVLLVKNIPGALLIGIAITTICGIPFGLTHLDGIVSMPPSVEPIFMQFEWHNIFTVDMVMVVFSFLFMDLFDTLGTLVSLLYKGGYVKDGRMPRMKESFFADAVGTTIGACFGTSAISTYVESAAGVSVGGKSGLTSLVIAVCFFLSLFLAPLFLSIPAQATAPVLILVGFLMISCIKEIDLEDYAEAIPAFICIITIPLTYSIANGIVFGLLSYVLINLISGKFKKIRIEMYLLSVFFIVMLFLH